jgi:flagellar basal body rod protein FlgB
MHLKKKIITTIILVALVSAGVAAVNAPKYKFRNLKVLPKDISDAKLDSIMESYNIALGVKCNFCHVPFNKMDFARRDSLDFASDAEPMKENARDMMRMVIEINKNNFYFDKNIQPEYLNTVTCKTCHRGEHFPPED